MTALELPSWAESTEAAQNEIRSALEKWQSAFNDRDERQVCDIFAPDLVANYQGAPERDYASLCQLLQTAVQDPDPKETVEETAVDIFRHQADGSWKISRYLAYPASP